MYRIDVYGFTPVVPGTHGYLTWVYLHDTSDDIHLYTPDNNIPLYILIVIPVAISHLFRKYTQREGPIVYPV